MKTPPATWLLCVWKISGFRTVYQIDMVDLFGKNEGSTNPATLRAKGYDIPDLSHLPHGQFTFAQIESTNGDPVLARRLQPINEAALT